MATIFDFCIERVREAHGRLLPRRWPRLLVLPLLLFALQSAPAFSADKQTQKQPSTAEEKVGKSKKDSKEAQKKRAAQAKARAQSLQTLTTHLGVGKGATIADIGAGGGQDTWVFAKIVGEGGKVLAEEITEDKTKKLEAEAKKRGLSQVQVVTGGGDDPCLPPDSADLAYVRYVYHHFSKPREMLRGIWHALKPGGHLLVIDRRRGTLQDWVPREQRSKKHFWLAETTVVREAREEGFAFVECAEERWAAKEPFVLVLQRPKEQAEPGCDPDPLLPLAEGIDASAFLPDGGRYQQPVFVALGEARKFIKPILEKSSGEGLDIVLEEWATQKEERPHLPSNVTLPSTLTEKGDPHFGPDPIDAVFFLDTYHLLFHGETLLAKIHEKLLPTGRIYVLDRTAKKPLSRRDASHSRQIAPKTVKQEMAAAGFCLLCEGPQLAADRFLLVFGKSKPE